MKRQGPPRTPTIIPDGFAETPPGAAGEPPPHVAAPSASAARPAPVSGAPGGQQRPDSAAPTMIDGYEPRPPSPSYPVPPRPAPPPSLPDTAPRAGGRLQLLDIVFGLLLSLLFAAGVGIGAALVGP